MPKFKKGEGYWKGKKRPKFSKEWLEKIKKANNGFKKGNRIWRGRKHSDTTKEKMRLRQGGFNNPSWKGGISKQKGYHNQFDTRRRARKAGNGGSHTFGEWETLKAQYNWTCPCCKRKEPEVKLTRDHIVPISRGGSDNIENIQPLCLKCNDCKYTKTIKYENKI